MADVGSLNAKLTLDMSDFRAGMEQAVQVAQALGQELNAVMSGNPFMGLGQAANESTMAVNNLRAAMEDFRASLQSVSGADIFAAIKAYTSEAAAAAGNAAMAMEKFSSYSYESLSNIARLRDALKDLSAIDLETGEIAGSGEDSLGLAFVGKDLEIISQLLTTILGQLAQCVDMTANWNIEADKVVHSLGQARNSLEVVRSSSKQTSQAMDGASNSAKKLANNTDKAKKGLQTTKGYAVSIKQIIGGIVISQAFYSMLGVMERLLAGAKEFSATMEEATIKLQYLFSSSERNKDVGVMAYINQMKEMSLQTGLSAATLMENAEQLQAMGFTARASIPAIAILADTTSIFSGSLGDANTQMAYLIKALGQMLSSGHVSAQELRQLYNAGLPIYDILSKALNISVEEARNIGKLNYDSATAVYGILKELQRRYGGASQALTHTFTGALNVIKEGLTQIVDYAWNNVFKKVSSWLDKVAQWVKALAKIGQAYGPGGIFQALFPESAWEPIRQLISAFRMLAASVRNVMQIVSGAFLRAFKGLLPIFAQVAQRAAGVAYALTTMLKYAVQNVPVLQKLLSILAAFTICSLVAKAVVVLAKALYLLSGAKLIVTSLISVVKALITLSPGAIAVILSIAAAFTILYSVCGGFKEFINDTFNKISETTKKFAASLGDAFDTSKILTPEFNEPETDDWSAGLQDLIDGWDDVADAEDEANKKKKKYLQSFDEVFTINDKDDDDAGAGIGGIADALKDLSNLSLGDMTGWLGQWDLDWGAISSGLEGIGESAFSLKDAFSTLTQDLDFGKFATDAWEKVKEAIISNPDFVGGSLGGAIGYVLGRIMGGPGGALIGAALGTLAGSITGKFWSFIAEAFGLEPEVATQATIASSIVGTLGFIIGKALGGTGTGLLFAAIGSAAAGLVEIVWGGIQKAFGYSDSTKWAQVFTGIGEGLVLGLQKFLEQLHIVQFITAALGANGASAEQMATIFSGGLKIAIKEGLKKGLLGALAGIGIGFLSDIIVGWIGKSVGKSEEDIKRSGTWSSWGGTLLSIIGGVLGTFVFPGLGTMGGALLGQAIGNLLGGLTGLFKDEIGTFFTQTLPAALSVAWEATANFFTTTVPNFFISVGTVIGEAFATAWNGVKTFFTETIPSWWRAFGEGLRTFFTETIPNFLYDAGFAIGQALGTIVLAIGTFFTETIPTLWNNFLAAMTTFFTETIPAVWASFTEALTTFFTVTIPNAWNAFIKAMGEFFTAVGNAIVTFFTVTIPNAWNSFINALAKFFTETIPNLWNSFLTALGNFFTNVINACVTFFTVTLPEKWNAFVEKVTSLGKAIIDGIWNGLQGAVGTIWSWISNFFSGFVDGFKSVFGIHSPSKEMEPLGKNIIEGLKSGMGDVLGSIGSWLKNKVGTPITEWFSNHMGSSDFLSYGKNVMEGLKSGISSMVSSVKDTASSVCGKIVGAIKDTFNIHSPSKVTEEIGEYVDEGLMVGMENLQSKLTRSAAALSNSVLESLQPEDADPFEGLTIRENNSIKGLKTWATTFAEIVEEMVIRVSSSFDTLNDRLVGAAAALANGSVAMNANMGYASANGSYSGGYLTGTPERMSLSEETIELLAAKMSEHAYEYFAPIIATNNSEDSQKSVAYVGTLIADDRSLKELNRKLQIIQLSENARRGH